MAVNVRAPLFLIQAAAEVMRREGVAGSIVSIGSTSGHGGQPFILSYCVSKGALETHDHATSRISLMRHKHPRQRHQPGLDGHRVRGRRRSASSTARPTAGSNGPRPGNRWAG